MHYIEPAVNGRVGLCQSQLMNKSSIDSVAHVDIPWDHGIYSKNQCILLTL